MSLHLYYFSICFIFTITIYFIFTRGFNLTFLTGYHSFNWEKMREKRMIGYFNLFVTMGGFSVYRKHICKCKWYSNIQDKFNSIVD